MVQSLPKQCWDNAVAESFFASIKLELVDRRPWATRAQARQAIFEYTRFSTTAAGSTPRSATYPRPSTKLGRSTTARPLKRHSQGVRQTGSIPNRLPLGRLHLTSATPSPMGSGRVKH